MKVYGRVYRLINKFNNKSYIGITTKPILERVKDHINKTANKRSAIQKALNKYGISNFEVEELEIAYSKEDLFLKEIYWISKFNTFLGYGYNLTAGGGGITNMSLEIREKISKTKTGKKVPKLREKRLSEECKIRISRKLGGHQILLTNVKTNEQILLNTAHEGRKLGINPSNIISCCKGRRATTKGYSCQYVTPILT